MIIHLESLDYNKCTGVLCIPDSHSFHHTKFRLSEFGGFTYSLKNI